MLDAWHIDKMDSGATLWVARLSDGSLIYQDDGRPDTTASSWFRLRETLRGRTLKGLGIRFRKREIWTFSEAWLEEVRPRGVFFARKMEGFIGASMRKVYVLGWVVGEKIYCEEREERLLDLLRTDVRPLDVDHPGVILWG